MTLILPGGGYVRRDNPLAEHLRSHNKRTFRTHLLLADAISDSVRAVAMQQRMQGFEVLNGVLTSLVSIVQAAAPETEWRDFADVLADEIKHRLTVEQVN